MSVRTRVAKKRFKKYAPLFIGFVKQHPLPRKRMFYISSNFDKIRCELEDIVNKHMKKLSNVIPVTQFTIRFGRLGECIFIVYSDIELILYICMWYLEHRSRLRDISAGATA